MLIFSIHTMIADLKSVLHGWLKYCVFIFIIFAVIIPFIPDTNALTAGYFIVMMISLFRPMFTKIYHVVPLTVADIRKIVWYRILLFSLLFSTLFLIVYAITRYRQMDYNRNAIYYLLFYICCIIFISLSAIPGFKTKKSTKSVQYGILVFINIVVMITAMLNCFGLLEYIKNTWIVVTLSVLPVLTDLAASWFYMRKLDFYDYVYVPDQMWNRKKKENS